MKPPGSPSEPSLLNMPVWLNAFLFAVAYYGSAVLGNAVSLHPGPFVTVWLPCGLFVGVLVLHRQRHWPVLVLAAFLANLAFDLGHGTALRVTVLFGVGNSLEALVGAWLVQRFFGPRPDLDSLRQMVGFLLCTAIFSSALGACVGAAVVSYCFGAPYWSVWPVWYSGNLLGITLLAPGMIVWRNDLLEPGRFPGAGRVWQEVLYWALICVAAFIIFNENWHPGLVLNYLLLPLLVFGAFHYGMREVTLASLGVALVGAWMTSQGQTHLSRSLLPPRDQAMALQFLLGVSAFSCMAIAALLAERRQAMERLVEEHQFNEQIFRSAREGVIVYGPDRAIQAWNPFMEQLSGVTASEAIGCQPMELFPFLSEVGFGERLDKVLAGEPVETIDFPFQVPWTGRCGWASDASAPFLDSKGAIVGVIATVRDITERRQTEAEKAVLQAQLQQSQKLESLGTLAGGVAHDMNNVLGAILSLASAHETLHPQGSPVHQAFTTIAEAATRGGKMVRSLLTFARQQPAEEQVLDLNALLRQNLDLLEHTTLARVRLVTEFAPDLLPVKGDPGALVSGFMNLCVNAVDAMPANGTLTLRTRNLAGGWVEAVVEDTGTGMPKEVLDKALDPFFTTKEVGKGTGLGLSMVFSTVKAHGGELAIRSEPGQGTQVTVRFPVSV